MYYMDFESELLNTVTIWFYVHPACMTVSLCTIPLVIHVFNSGVDSQR